MSVLLFVKQNKSDDDGWEIQLQLDGATVNLQAASLSFLHDIYEFIVRTRGNKVFRDEKDENSVLHTMPNLFCDLSESFTTSISVAKDGEYDDSYIMRISLNAINWMSIDIRGDDLTEFVNELEVARDDWF